MEKYVWRESAMRDSLGVHRPRGGSEARKGIGRKANPKQVQAEKDGKTPYEYLVLSVLEDDAHVHKHGGDKYGKRNWQLNEILASTYIGAMFRHYKAWSEGEDLDPDSGRPHLTHLRACCAVVMDGAKHGKLIDDRLDAWTNEPEAKPGQIIFDEAADITREQWVIIETLGEPADGRIRGYGTFPSKEAAKSYGIIVRRASAKKNYCSVMKVNDVKNIRTSR